MARIDRLPEAPRHLLQTRCGPRTHLSATPPGGALGGAGRPGGAGAGPAAGGIALRAAWRGRTALRLQTCLDAGGGLRQPSPGATAHAARQGGHGDRSALPRPSGRADRRLVHHARQGELWDKAVLYCRQAGTRAMAHSAYREAVTYFEQALDALHQLPAGPDTQAQAIDLRLDLRSALWPLGEIERISGYVAGGCVPRRELWVIYTGSGGFRPIYWPILGRCVNQTAPWRLAIAPWRWLRPGKCRPYGQGAVTAWAGLFQSGGLSSGAGAARGRTWHVSTATCSRSASGLPGLASVLSRHRLVASLAECGAFVEGRACAEEGVRIAEAADHSLSRIVAYWAVGFQALRQGNLHQAIPGLERALGLAQGTHIPALPSPSCWDPGGGLCTRWTDR